MLEVFNRFIFDFETVCVSYKVPKSKKSCRSEFNRIQRSLFFDHYQTVEKHNFLIDLLKLNSKIIFSHS